MILPRQDNNNNDPVFGTDDDEFAYDSFWYTKVCLLPRSYLRGCSNRLACRKA